MQPGADHPNLVLAVARTRDREAFAVLFDHYAPRVEAFLLRMGVERGQAEDIAQDTLTVLWRKAELFDPTKSSLSTWLYRIARNRRIDRLRRDRLDYKDPAELGPDLPDETLPEPGARVDGSRREAALRRALGALPPEQIELVGLAFYDGLSHSEIAARTNLPLGTVKSRIRIAFSHLRKALERDGVTDAV